MYNRLLSFIDKQSILYAYQFGFRMQRSPNLALIILVDRISKALENGDFVLGLFLDFSKAFDMVNHSILYEKLEFHGVRGGVTVFFCQSYLSDRTQYVEYNNVHSTKSIITCGIPQGSILGPLLFPLYIFSHNTLFHIICIFWQCIFTVSMSTTCCWYIIFTLPGQNTVTSVISSYKYQYFKYRKTIWTDLSKSNSSRPVLQIPQCIRQTSLNAPFRKETCPSPLWTVHRGTLNRHHRHPLYIDDLCNVSKRLFALLFADDWNMSLSGKKTDDLSRTMSEEMVKVVVWLQINRLSLNLNKTHFILFRAIRTIVGARKYEQKHYHCFRMLNYWTSKDYISIVCKYWCTNTTTIFSDFYIQNNSVHEYHTRQENMLHVPLIRTVPLSKSVRVTRVLHYNHFKRSICLKVSFVTYKYNLKRHIIDNDSLNLVKTSWPKLPWWMPNCYYGGLIISISILVSCADCGISIA